VRGDLSRPCASFNRAYALAQCGDLVSVSSGSYGKQAIADTSRSCSGNPVTIKGSATVLKIQLGTTGQQWGFSSDGPDDLVIDGFKLTWGIEAWSDAANVTVQNVDGGSFFVQGPTNLALKNSDWGPCTPSGSYNGQFSACRHYFEGDPNSGQPRLLAGSNILLENNTFHDMVIDVSGAHWECLFMNVVGLSNVTFRGNSFSNCETDAISIGNGGSSSNISGNWVFENNTIGACPGGTAGGNGPYCVNFTGIPWAANVNFRNNTFVVGEYLGCEAGCGSYPGLTVSGNTFGAGTVCIPGATYLDNIFMAPGSGCS
jgi:hypothetical protein